eukprot:scaffold681511_cov135-Prasinocladus_malaysianus.AAC.1
MTHAQWLFLGLASGTPAVENAIRSGPGPASLLTEASASQIEWLSGLKPISISYAHTCHCCYLDNKSHIVCQLVSR